MNLKELILLGAIATGAPMGTEAQNTTTQNQIYEVFSEEKENGETDQEIITEKIGELNGTPFRGNKRMIKANYGNLLGYKQAETILKEYNNYQSDQEFSANKLFKETDIINFPLIYPELSKYFPKRISNLFKEKAFEKYKNTKADHIIIITQCDNGNNALGYYEKGELKMASYVSIGKNRTKTISGKYIIKHAPVFRRSKKYKNSAMPYSLHIKGGYFIHQGRSNGSPQSHGCVRAPGLYQKRLYKHLPEEKEKPDNKIIILEGLYTPTLRKQANNSTIPAK